MTFLGKPQRQLPPLRSYEDPANGIRVISATQGAAACVTVKGELAFQSGDTILIINFKPEGREVLVKSKISDSLVRAALGMDWLLTEIDKGYSEDTPLLGVTNRRMALIAERFGFSIVDRDREPDGTVKNSTVLVVGKIPDIRVRIEEFTRSATFWKLMDRAIRQSEMEKLARK